MVQVIKNPNPFEPQALQDSSMNVKFEDGTRIELDWYEDDKGRMEYMLSILLPEAMGWDNTFYKGKTAERRAKDAFFVQVGQRTWELAEEVIML